MLNAQRSFFIFLIISQSFITTYSMQLGLFQKILPKKSFRFAARSFKHGRSKSIHSAVDTKTVQAILKPLKTEQDKWRFYNLITNRHNAIAWKTIKINKKKRLPIYCMPYQSRDDHLALIFLLKSVHKNNLALAYQKFFHALSAHAEQHLKLHKLMSNNEPTKAINELCLNTATEKIVRALQAELEPELKIINVTL